MSYHNMFKEIYCHMECLKNHPETKIVLHHLNDTMTIFHKDKKITVPQYINIYSSVYKLDKCGFFEEEPTY
jgi:hypothetical protein